MMTLPDPGMSSVPELPWNLHFTSAVHGSFYLLKPSPAAFAIRLFVTFGKANYGMRTGKPQCLRLFSEKNCFDLFY